jgi:hypothetical protein
MEARFNSFRSMRRMAASGFWPTFPAHGQSETCSQTYGAPDRRLVQGDQDAPWKALIEVSAPFRAPRGETVTFVLAQP